MVRKLGDKKASFANRQFIAAPVIPLSLPCGHLLFNFFIVKRCLFKHGPLIHIILFGRVEPTAVCGVSILLQRPSPCEWTIPGFKMQCGSTETQTLLTLVETKFHYPPQPYYLLDLRTICERKLMRTVQTGFGVVRILLEGGDHVNRYRKSRTPDHKVIRLRVRGTAYATKVVRFWRVP